VTDKPRILVADDDKLVQSAFSDILKYSGYSVIPAWDGEEALAVAQAEQPDLILLDIMMPKRNGLQVTHELKLNPATRAIPIIIVTALLGATAPKLIPAEVYLQKPVRPGALLDHVRRLLAARGSAPLPAERPASPEAAPPPGT